ncbi:MAG: toll/interleukin-1 receptor domain-containing protein [Nitrospira sp.]
MAPCNVFLSYSRHDRLVVEPIAKILRVTRSVIFRDEDSIPLGKRWESVIGASLISCHTVIVFWSTAASDSKAVASEYSRGIQLKKDIVPVLLDDTPLDEALAKYQCLDFREVVRSGQTAAIMIKTSAVVGTFYIPGIDSALWSAKLLKLLLDAQKDGIGVKWNKETETLVANMLSSRLDGTVDQVPDGDT